MSQQINLYNPLYLKQKKIFSVVTMGQALTVLVIGLAATYGYARYQVSALQTETNSAVKRLEGTQARVARLGTQFGPRQKSADLEARVQQAEAELKALANVQAALRAGGAAGTSGFSPYFKALAKQSVEGLWLTGFRVAGDEMEISGRTLKPEAVPEYIRRLGSEQVMQGRKFAMLEMRQPDVPKTKEGKPGTIPAYVEFTLRSSVDKEAK